MLGGWFAIVQTKKKTAKSNTQESIVSVRSNNNDDNDSKWRDVKQ